MANLQVGVAGNGTVTVGAGASVHSPASNELTLGTNNAERVRINSSGNFGVGDFASVTNNWAIQALRTSGSTTIASKNTGGNATVYIEASDTNTAKLELTEAGTGSYSLQVGNDNALMFFDDSSERVRIDNSGRLLVGTTSNTSPIGWGNNLQVAGTSAVAGVSIRRDSADTGGALVVFGKSRGSLNGNTVVQDGDQIGGMYFAGADGTDVNSIAAQISVEVDAAPGSNDMPGRILLKTTSDGAASPTERVRVSKHGQLVLSNGSMSVAYGNSLCGGTNLELDTSGIIKFRTDTNQKMSVTDNGLCFGTDSASANALNDYEEGSWTPVPARYTGGNANLSMSTQNGKYTKIGNKVRIEFYIVISSVTSQGSSLTQLRGLPFLPNASYQNTGVCFYNDGFQHDDDTDYTIITTVHQDNGGVVYFKANGCDAGNGLSTKNFQAGTITGSCTYLTDS